MAVRIVVDSTVDLAKNIQNRFTVVPLTIRFGAEEYIHGVTLDNETFYQKLATSSEMPSTSQATPGAFEAVFKSITEAGDQALAITISSQLSGTYQSAAIAAQAFPGKAFVVDSMNVAIGTGILAELALSLAESGMNAEAIVNQLQRERESITLIAMVDTLEYLKRGGRISSATAFAGSLLSIKPVIGMVDGKLEVLGKARGVRQGFVSLTKRMEEGGGVDFAKPYLLGYTGQEDTLLQKYMESSASLWEGKEPKGRIALVGSVVGTHAGPGAVAAAFFRK